MVLVDSQKQFLLHLESYLLYEKEHEVRHCYQLCLLPVVVCCQYIEANMFLKGYPLEAKTASKN